MFFLSTIDDFYYSCFTLLDRNSSTIRNRSSKSQDYSCSWSQGKSFQLFIIKCDVIYGFWEIPFTILRKFHSRLRKFFSYLNIAAVVVVNCKRGICPVLFLQEFTMFFLLSIDVLCWFVYAETFLVFLGKISLNHGFKLSQ